MMKTYFHVLVLAVAFLLSAFLYTPTNAATYKFMYLSFDSKGNGKVISIDPLIHTVTSKNISVFPNEADNTEFHIDPSWVSPSQEWIALDYGVPNSAGVFRLLNVQNGATQDIGSNILHIDSPMSEQTVVWARNSQYIAFSSNYDDPANDIFHAYVYSMLDNRAVQLTTDQTIPIRFAWSQDSSLLAIEGKDTNANRTKLDLVDIRTNTLYKSIDLTYIAGSDVNSICDIGWSPDARFVSFVSNCDVSFTHSQEVYLLDLVTGNINQITSLTSQMLTRLTPIAVFSHYYLKWLSTSQLMIGMLVWDENVQIAQTLSYDPLSKRLAIFSKGQLQEAATNLVTGHVALVLSPSFYIDNIRN